jgi:tetrapyrrole methylase family protein/MazG family protein
LVTTNRVLRVECPWDRAQTHHSLLRHLIEETYETVEAVSGLPESAPAGPVDFGAYALLEEELGDLLLQVVFHAGLAAEAGAFDVDEVAEQIRRKLVRRHPHVFGDIEVSGAGEVLANWEVLKSEEKSRESLMDDIPTALPGIARADKIQRRAATIGFDWADVDPVLAKVEEELGELRAAGEATRTDELGDLLFAVVNLARHLDVDPEIALARASDTFIARFRMMERLAAGREIALASLDLAAMDALWDEAKERTRAG